MFSRTVPLLAILTGTLTLGLACDAPVETQSDDFVPSFDWESLEETTLRKAGPVRVDNLDRYVHQLGVYGGDTIDASVALLDELDWPYAVNVEEYVWYPRGWYASGCDSIDSLAEFESCILESRALDMDNNPIHEVWFAEYIAFMPDIPNDSARSATSNSTTCRCMWQERNHMKLDSKKVTAESSWDAAGEAGFAPGQASIGGSGSSTSTNYEVFFAECGVKRTTTGELCEQGWFWNACERAPCKDQQDIFPTEVQLLSIVGGDHELIFNDAKTACGDASEVVERAWVQECPEQGNFSSATEEHPSTGDSGGSDKGDGGTSVGGSEGEVDGFFPKGG